MKNNLILLILAIFSFSSCAQTSQVKQVTSVEASKLLSGNQKYIVLDVRTPEEFKVGHIGGAINLDMKNPEAFSLIDTFDRNANYIVHCRTNHRSTVAVDHMNEKGFRNILQMTDGYSGWRQNNLPEVQ